MSPATYVHSHSQKRISKKPFQQGLGVGFFPSFYFSWPYKNFPKKIFFFFSCFPLDSVAFIDRLISISLRLRILLSVLGCLEIKATVILQIWVVSSLSLTGVQRAVTFDWSLVTYCIRTVFNCNLVGKKKKEHRWPGIGPWIPPGRLWRALQAQYLPLPTLTNYYHISSAATCGPTAVWIGIYPQICPSEAVCGWFVPTYSYH